MDGRTASSRVVSNILFKLQFLCFVSALFMDGFGNIIFGFVLPTNVSTIFIFLALIFQLTFGKFRIPVFLIIIYTYITIQTFVFNFSESLFSSSLVHFIGMVLYSVTAFSFVSAYRNLMLNMVQNYYKFCLIIACIAILQSIVFVVIGKSISLHQILGGPPMHEMSAEIFGLLPRATGTASEPTTFATILMPGVYISLLVLAGRGSMFNLKNKIVAGIVLTGFVLSFSLVGFMGFIISILIIAITGLGKSRRIEIFIAIGLIFGGFVAINNMPIGSKLTSLASMSTNPTDLSYTTNDLSGFALVSNMLVAQEALSRSYYFGTGVNTHESTYDDVMPVLFDKSQIIYELNKKDAGSLFIRLASEFGIPGLLVFIIFLLRYKLFVPYEYSAIQAINDMCFIVLVVYASRNGSYISVLFWLFLALYLYSFTAVREAKRILKNKTVFTISISDKIRQTFINRSNS
jgi:O-antigen ligase